MNFFFEGYYIYIYLINIYTIKIKEIHNNIFELKKYINKF